LARRGLLLTDAADWTGYVAGFHAQHAGITEDVLEHARDSDGMTPYDWAAEAVTPGLTVLDLACGSAPMHAHLRAGAYVGVDLSAAEPMWQRPGGCPSRWETRQCCPSGTPPSTLWSCRWR